MAKPLLRGLAQNITIDDLVTPSDFPVLEMNFGGITDLVVRLRNQYFHNLTGKDVRFTPDDIPDPDEFFACINSYVANWLAVIFFQIVEYELVE